MPWGLTGVGSSGWKMRTYSNADGMKPKVKGTVTVQGAERDDLPSQTTKDWKRRAPEDKGRDQPRWGCSSSITTEVKDGGTEVVVANL